MEEQEFKKLGNPNADIEGDKEKFKQDLEDAYRNIIHILKEYCDVKEKYYNIIALWIIGTYFHKQFPSYPFLFFNAMKGSGKSRILNLITCLAKDGELLNALTEAVLFRTSGVLAIDEFEGVSRKGGENLRELLNSAYKRGAKVKRMKQQKTEKGMEMVVEEFEVYRPILLANIWGMENVLGDRCIALILERSSKQNITNLVEIFKEEKIVQDTVEILNQCSLCSFMFRVKTYKDWNNYVKSNYTNYTYNTNNTNNTNNIIPLSTFEIIKNMDLNGRELELSFPLCLIANEISPEVLKETTLTLKEIFEVKKVEELNENIDISLYDFVSQELETGFISMNEIVRRFKEFSQQNDEWINNRWMGRALKRLDLRKESRRIGRGVTIILNIEKAIDKMRLFR